MKARVPGIALAAILSLTVAPVRATAPPDVVVAWNEIMITTTGSQNPFAQARIAAATQLAVHEAVNAITREHEPYGDPIGAPAGASVEAAAATAAHDVLVALLPAAATSLDASLADTLAGLPEGAAKVDGMTVGHDAAAAIVALRTNDGSSPAQFFLPTSDAPGSWQTTATCPPAGGILYHWQNVRPFGIRSNSQFRAAPPPALSSTAYAKAYEEVARMGDVASTDRPQDRTDVARFYNAYLAVAVWNRVAQQLAGQEPASLSGEARAFALLNMAMSDALTSVMETKYHYLLWRPETAIRGGDADGNPATVADPGFAPLIPTPCFPSYTSAHASASYAGRWVLERAWGGGGHHIVLTHPAQPGLELRYTRLKQITDDIDDARVYGGIHFRFDQEAGGTLGREVAQYISAHQLLDVSL